MNTCIDHSVEDCQAGYQLSANVEIREIQDCTRRKSTFEGADECSGYVKAHASADVRLTQGDDTPGHDYRSKYLPEAISQDQKLRGKF